MAKRKLADGVQEEELGSTLTPMIDVIFQLLIFFMVNIKFRTLEGLLKAFLPKVASAPTQKQPEKVLIKLADAGGRVNVTVNGRIVGGVGQQQFSSLQTMLKGIKENYAGREMPPVIIDADATVEYRYVISALNVCGRLKLDNVMFALPS